MRSERPAPAAGGGGACAAGSPAPLRREATGRRGIRSRIAGGLRWLVPAAVWLALPKCPACFAAYIALFTGVSLSFPAAAALRWALLGVCVVSLAWMLVRVLRPRRGCGVVG